MRSYQFMWVWSKWKLFMGWCCNLSQVTTSWWGCYQIAISLFNDFARHFNLVSRSPPPRSNYKTSTHLISHSTNYVQLLDVVANFDTKWHFKLFFSITYNSPRRWVVTKIVEIVVVVNLLNSYFLHD